MDNELPEIEQSEGVAKPRSPRRQAKTDHRVWVYEVVGGKNNERGSFPEATVGSPVDRRIPAFVKEMFGAGEYKVDLRTAKGVPVRTFQVSLTEDLSNDVDSVDDDFEDLEDTEYGHQGFSAHNPQQPAAGMTQAEVENILLKERLQMLEQQRANGQNESTMMLTLLQSSWDQQRQFMAQQIEQMRAANSQPREDATAQALKMMEASLGMVTRARAIAEELAPEPGSASGESSWLADGAKLVSEVGKFAGPAMPFIASMLTQPAAAPPPPAPQYGGPNPQAQPQPQQNNAGEFSGLAAAAKAKNNGKAAEGQKS